MASNRPKCNSILHLFGKWLFEAAFIGSEFAQQQQQQQDQQHHQQQQHKANLDSSNHRRVSASSQSASIDSSLELPSALTPERFESGRAEALGALCRVVCAKKTGEEILPAYLARFYLALQQGLALDANKVVGETLAAILVNSGDLLRLDLEGVGVLLPFLVTALEAVLPERELKMRPGNVGKVELRRAAIDILTSMLALPAHFQTLNVKEMAPGLMSEPASFAGLKARLASLALNALQVETEAANAQALLGALAFLVHDSAALETVEAKRGRLQNDRGIVASTGTQNNDSPCI